MKIAIYGAGNYGQYVCSEILNHKQAKMSVAFWIDNFVEEQERCGLPIYTAENFLKQHKFEEVDAVVVAIDPPSIAYKAALSLLLQGYKKVYLAWPKGFIPKVPILDEEGEFGYFIKSYDYFEELKPVVPMMVVLVTNRCNLNCKRCAHYSNLVTREDFLELGTFENYLVQLKKKFKNILKFQLLGGEPLLNPQLELYILLARKYFPETRIEIATNGLMIQEISHELIKVMRQCSAVFRISQYPQIRKKLDVIIDFLEKEQIDYEITAPITQFRKMISLKESSGEKAFEKWTETDCGCHIIEEGRIYLCPSIPKLYNMKDYFGFYIDEVELQKSSIDLMDNTIDGWDIMRYFSSPVPLCKFCNPEETWVAWETGKPQKEDWIAD